MSSPYWIRFFSYVIRLVYFWQSSCHLGLETWVAHLYLFVYLQDRLYFQQLKQYVIDYDMLVDSLITKVTSW